MPRQEGRLLDAISARKNQRRTYRYANLPSGDFLAKLGFDAQSNQELRDILAAVRHKSDLNELCDGPFRRKRHFREPTRFSDGTFPVFYSSLEKDTAEAEIRFHFWKFANGQSGPLRFFYQQFSCMFAGMEKDLRAKLADWPELTEESDYDFCNRLGREAYNARIDGLIAPSARSWKGANLPVFNRTAISNPASGDLVSLTFDPNTGEISMAIVARAPDHDTSGPKLRKL